MDEMRQVERRETPSATRNETLSQLVARLGRPPGDVLDRWCQCVELFAIAAHTAGQAFPPTDADQWYLDRNGELRSSNQQVPDIDVRSVESGIRASARQHAALFRQQFAEPAESPFTSTKSFKSLARPELAVGRESIASKEKLASVEGIPVRWLPKVLVGSFLLLSVVAIAAILWRASQKISPPVAEQVGSRPVNEGVTRRGDHGSPSTEPVTQTLDPVHQDVLPDQLETFQLSSSDNDLSLDVMMPSMAILSTRSDSFLAASLDDEVKPSQETSDSENVSEPDSAMLSAIGGDDPLAESSGEDEPDESPQPIRQAGETVVGLPASDDIDSTVLLAPFVISSPSLEFPIEVGADLRRFDSEDANTIFAWTLIDRKSKETLANILVSQDQSEFQWTSAAKRLSTAKLICHGRLRDASGTLIFLRPKIIANPYAISFDRPDARPSWDLLSPLPPRIAGVSLDFDLPRASKKSEGIELGWIEPVDSTSPRRTRGLAVLKPTDGETIEVGLRFDLQCSRKLSARVRIFGRLDSSMPWQLISRPILENAADQITARATRLSQMSSQMSVAYSRAGSDQRRDLRPQRDAIEQENERVVEVSKRLAELQSLINKIENEVRVRFGCGSSGPTTYNRTCWSWMPRTKRDLRM